MVCVWAPNLHEEMDSRMTTVARRNPADKAKIDAIEKACQVVCVWGLVSRGIGRSGLGRPRPFG